MRRITSLVALLALAIAGVVMATLPAAAQTVHSIDVSKLTDLDPAGESVQVSATPAYGWLAGSSLAAYQCAALSPQACDTATTTGFQVNGDGSFDVSFAVQPTINPPSGARDCVQDGGCLIVVADPTIANYGYVPIAFAGGSTEEPDLPPPGEEPDFGSEVLETDVPPPGPCPALAGADTAEKSESAVGNSSHKLTGIRFDTNGCEDTFTVRYSNVSGEEIGWSARYLGTPAATAPAQLELRTGSTVDPVFGGNAAGPLPGLTYLESVQEQTTGDGSLIAVFTVRAGVPFKVTEKATDTFFQLTLELGPISTVVEPPGGGPKCTLPGADTASKLSDPSPPATAPAALRGVDAERRGCADRIAFRYKTTGGAPSYVVEYVAATREKPKAIPLVSGPLAALVAGTSVPQAVEGPAFLRITVDPASATNVSAGSRYPTGKTRFVRSITKTAEANGAVEAMIEVDQARPFRVIERSVKNGFELVIELGSEGSSGVIPGLELPALVQQASQQGFTITVADLPYVVGGPLAMLAAGKVIRTTTTGTVASSVFGAPSDVSLSFQTAAAAQMATSSQQGKFTGPLYGLTCAATGSGRSATVADAQSWLQWCASRPYTGASPAAASAWIASVLAKVTPQTGFSRLTGKGWLTVSAVTSGGNVVGYQLKLVGSG